MYTKVNAEKMNDWVIGFFDGKDHSGAKSDNKKYGAPPKEGITLKEGQADRRNNNLARAAEVRQAIHGKKQLIAQFTGQNPTPAEMGKIIFDQKLRGGNCAEMTWLLCHSFNTKLNIWIVVIEDPGDHQFCLLAAKQPAYNTIAAMDYLGEDQWIIDPWANIVCKPGEFATEFTNKMQKWTDRGKRIGVPAGQVYEWTAGSDPTYLSNILTSRLLYRKGWKF